MDRTSSTSGVELLGRLCAAPLARFGRQLQHPTGLTGRLVGHAMAFANRRANRAAVEALGIEPADEILELGFGPGAAIETLAALAPEGRIYGIDKSQEMLALACKRNKAAMRAGRVVLTQGSFDRLPLPAATVDKVLAVNVIYFWHEAGAVLSEIRRVLRPGGILAIYATDAGAMQRWKFAGPATHRTFDRPGLAALLEAAGFERARIDIRETCPAPGLRGWVATARQ